MKKRERFDPVPYRPLLTKYGVVWFEIYQENTVYCFTKEPLCVESGRLQADFTVTLTDGKWITEMSCYNQGLHMTDRRYSLVLQSISSAVKRMARTTAFQIFKEKRRNNRICDLQTSIEQLSYQLTEQQKELTKLLDEERNQ